MSIRIFASVAYSHQPSPVTGSCAPSTAPPTPLPPFPPPLPPPPLPPPPLPTCCSGGVGGVGGVGGTTGGFSSSFSLQQVISTSFVLMSLFFMSESNSIPP